MSYSHWSLSIPTHEGEFMAAYSEKGLCRLDFPRKDAQKAGLREDSDSLPPQVRVWHEQVRKALAAALNGMSIKELPPLDLSAGTPFQQAVWTALRGIEPGAALTYGQVAAAVGRPHAFRAVGAACGRNPIPVLVPCHRVIAAAGKLGGFSGGLEWKRLLLAREGRVF